MSSYIDHRFGNTPGGYSHEVALSWRQLTKLRLEWLYGAHRAWVIEDGRDPATQADIARWNALGRRSAA